MPYQEVYLAPYSKGTHKLIKQGAKLVEHIDDILEELNLTNCFYKSNIIPSSEQELSEIERKIMSMIDYQPTNIEQILQELFYYIGFKCNFNPS